MRKGEIWEKQGSPGKGLIFLLIPKSRTGESHKTLCGLLCPLDAAGMCGWIEELLA